MNITHSCRGEGGGSEWWEGRGQGVVGRGASENGFQGSTSVTDLFCLYLAPIINVYMYVSLEVKKAKHKPSQAKTYNKHSCRLNGIAQQAWFNESNERRKTVNNYWYLHSYFIYAIHPTSQNNIPYGTRYIIRYKLSAKYSRYSRFHQRRA